MNKRTLWLVLGVVMVFCAAAGIHPSPLHAQAPPGKQLTGAELLALFGAGATIEYESPHNGTKGIKTFNPDGTFEVKGKSVLNYEYTDTGTWHLEGDLWCEVWRRFNSEAGGCSRYFQVGENSYEKWDAKALQSRVRIRK